MRFVALMVRRTVRPSCRPHLSNRMYVPCPSHASSNVELELPIHRTSDHNKAFNAKTIVVIDLHIGIRHQVARSVTFFTIAV